MRSRFSGFAEFVSAKHVVHWVVATTLAMTLTAIHLRHGTRIFDIEFGDETWYLTQGAFGTADMSSHESSGLYCLYYRLLSFVIADPVDLYLRAGLTLVVICTVAAFVSFGILSRSPLCALIATAVFVFSHALLIWPRISFLAIILLASGLSAVGRVRSFFAKSSFLLLSTFFTAFVRPEFVLAFYASIVMTIVLGALEVIRAIRTRSIAVVLRREHLPAWACIFTTLILIGIWSFPILRSDHRAFVAFGQHFALRHVLTNGLAINPSWNYQLIVGAIFPGATAVSDALRIAPATFMKFILANTFELAKQLATYLKHAVAPRPNAVLAMLAMWSLLGYALWISLKKLRSNAHPSAPSDHAWRIEDIAAIAVALVLMAPPTVSCIVIYPREHYTVMILYLLLACCALAISRIGGPSRSLPATVLAGMGLILATPSLPVRSQINGRDIAIVRGVPGIQVLYEGDLGWCTYYLPHCLDVFPTFERNQSLVDVLAVHHVDSVMISPGLRAVRWIAEEPMFHDLETSPERYGYRAIPLPSGRVLLKR